LAAGVGSMSYLRRVRRPDPFDVDCLRRILTDNRWFMDVLRMVRDFDPPNWLVGAGVLRNVVWDRLHDFDIPTPVRDVDVAYFNSAELARERDDEIAAELRAPTSTPPGSVRSGSPSAGRC
jgi:hypothetical protein